MFSVAFPTTGIIVDTWLVARLLGETNSGNGARWLNVIGLVVRQVLRDCSFMLTLRSDAVRVAHRLPSSTGGYHL